MRQPGQPVSSSSAAENHSVSAERQSPGSQTKGQAKESSPPPPRRDVTLLSLERGSALVIACDSCGGVGEKPGDAVQVPPEITGYYTCRVAALEVLSMGACILSVIDTLSVEWEPTGRRILAGIRKFLVEAGLAESIAVNGSTEENFAMTQTAMGITVIGQAPAGKLITAAAQPGDLLVAAGLPKVGHEIRHPLDPEVVSLDDFMTIRQQEGVHDMIPVGSKGIRYEGELLGALSGLQVRWREQPDQGGGRMQIRGDLSQGVTVTVDLSKSGGPATCVLAAMTRKAFEDLAGRVKAPFHILGSLYPKTG